MEFQELRERSVTSSDFVESCLAPRFQKVWENHPFIFFVYLQLINFLEPERQPSGAGNSPPLETERQPVGVGFAGKPAAPYYGLCEATLAKTLERLSKYTFTVTSLCFERCLRCKGTFRDTSLVQWWSIVNFSTLLFSTRIEPASNRDYVKQRKRARRLDKREMWCFTSRPAKTRH